MKVFIVLVGFLAAVYAGAFSPAVGNGRSAIDDSIIGLIECLREKMPEGIGQLGPLDPLVIELLEIALEGALTLDGYIQNCRVVGLSDFLINTIKFNVLGLKLDFDFLFSGINAECYYDLDGTAGGFIPIFGKGPAAVEVGDVNLSGQVQINTKDAHLNLKQFILKIAMGHFKADIQGLLGGGEISILLNRVINDLVPQLLEQNEDVISELADVMVKDIANPVLNNLTLSDLMDMIGGDGGGLC